MSSTKRRSLPKAPLATPNRLATASGPSAEAPSSAQSRRTFLQATAGAAAGVAVVAGGPKLAAAALHGGSNTSPLGEIVKPSGPPQAETVMAYVRDGALGEFTVLSGTRETTYRDPLLAQRLIDAGR
jgi:nitrous oxide reductase